MRIFALVLELQEDIAHSEVQDSVMCSAGRTSFCDLIINKCVAALIHDDAEYGRCNATQDSTKQNSLPASQRF